MHISVDTADIVLAPIVAGAAQGKYNIFSALEAMDAPIYVTDANGFVTYFNPACIGFSGRTPQVGKDRWCVTWKLFTTAGDYLPHENCPMAEAIKSAKPVRGLTAIAERPDGVRVRFAPFPTPLFGPAGELTGAINILIDVTENRLIADLHAQADRCRRLALTTDPHTAKIMNDLAAEYTSKAADLRGGHQLHATNYTPPSSSDLIRGELVREVGRKRHVMYGVRHTS